MTKCSKCSHDIPPGQPVFEIDDSRRFHEACFEEWLDTELQKTGQSFQDNSWTLWMEKGAGLTTLAGNPQP